MTDALAQDPFAHWGDRTPLLDDEGGLGLVFSLAESTRGGRPWADGVWRPGSVPTAAAADLVESALAGHVVSTSDVDLVAELRRRGAAEVRHAHVMSHRLDPLPRVEPPAGLVVGPLSADDLRRHADELGAIGVRAYPPEHPDHEFDEVAAAVRELHDIADGVVLGPYLGVSSVARFGDAVVGCCLVVDRPGVAPEGGPWIIDVFRDPAAGVKRVGATLIAASLAAARMAGLPSVSLAVSHSNANALALYLALGFDDADESWTLAVG